MQLLADLFGDLWRPLRVFIVAAFGLFFAVLLLNGDYRIVITALAITIGIAQALSWVGDALLPRQPRLALVFLECWVIAPGAIAAIGSGLAVFVCITAEVFKPADPELAGLLTAGATAVVALFTGAFVAWVGEQDDSRTADRIRRFFFAHYDRQPAAAASQVGRKHYFAAESRGERAVYSDEIEGVAGWGLPARWRRAKILAEELASGTSDPPSP